MVAESIQDHDSKMWSSIHIRGKEGPKKFWDFVKCRIGQGPCKDAYLPNGGSINDEIVEKLHLFGLRFIKANQDTSDTTPIQGTMVDVMFKDNSP